MFNNIMCALGKCSTDISAVYLVTTNGRMGPDPGSEKLWSDISSLRSRNIFSPVQSSEYLIS